MTRVQFFWYISYEFLVQETWTVCHLDTQISAVVNKNVQIAQNSRIAYIQVIIHNFKYTAWNSFDTLFTCCLLDETDHCLISEARKQLLCP